MVTEIRLYIEGGGDGKETKADLRRGFSMFFQPLVAQARERRIRWNITVCGGRDAAHRGFMTALETHSDAFNILLVDAEGPITSTPLRHLRQRDPSWHLPDDCEDNCHLMVQMMEAWFIADRKALRNFYGSGFQESALPGNRSVEEIGKDAIESALKAATRNSSKGEYHKIRHGSKLLEEIDSGAVREFAPYCERLFGVVAGTLG